MLIGGVMRTGVSVEFDFVEAPSGSGLVYNIRAFKVGDGVGLIVREVSDRV